ncbi:2OG-Fe(II) oxygenase [Limnoraphis robusta]|uniref:2OG-Fe(II) oxygenase n=1 Tax=Limnoraphis robusta TaxID=1118279 RepID=UPI002B1F7DB3|nr:2OG-Fe(II) oxygenase [Limnoraphis robusta]MEA5499309.1 2OG-Fe(II) oxygenase [Limnoraphis robusta BA-68 BA1]
MIENKSEFGGKMAHDILSVDRLKQLTNLSIETLESLLKSPDISSQQKAEIAFKILEMVGVSPENFKPSSISPSTNGFSKPTQPSPKTEPVPAPDYQSVIQKDSLFLPADHVFIENFLSPEENQKILEIALSKSDQFVGSTTTTQAVNYRQSSILYATLFPDFYNLMRNKLLQTCPEICPKLNHKPFNVSQVEMQLTAHNDGCFYKIHNDSGSEKTYTRVITYVYYFHQEPKQFSGGELRLYETELKAGSAISHNNYKTIEPRNNSIVFFDSRCKHEVMPVCCPSRKFEDGRFTLNGWLRREDN